MNRVGQVSPLSRPFLLGAWHDPSRASIIMSTSWAEHAPSDLVESSNVADKANQILTPDSEEKIFYQAPPPEARASGRSERDEKR